MSRRPPATGAALLDRRIHPPRSWRWRDLLFRAYVALLVAPALVLVMSQAVEALAALLAVELPMTAPHLHDAAVLLVTTAAALALLAGLHTATWLGPVVLDRGDMAWLTMAPLPRRVLLGPRLRGSIGRGLGWGAAGGALVGVVVALALDGLPIVLAAVGAVAGSSMGALLQVAGWWVLLAPDRSAGVLRALRVVLPLGAGLVGVAALDPVIARGLAWSGPWGWAATAVVRAATGQPVAVAIALGLLLLTAASASVWALRGSAVPPAEELFRRAGAAAGAATMVYLRDVAGLAEIRSESLAALQGPARARLPAPRRPRWAVVWRDATALIRAPARLCTGAGLGAAAGAGVVLAAVVASGAAGAAPDVGRGVPADGDEAFDADLGRALLLAVGALVATRISARSLLTGLRAAVARPFGHALLPWSHAGLVARHCALPTGLVVTAVLAGGGLAALAAREPPATWAPALLALGVGGVGVVLLAAADALAPPEDPVEAFEALLNETSAMLRALRRWPQMLVSAALLLPTVGAVLAAGTVPAWPLAAAVGGWSGAVAGLAAWRLRRTPPPWT